MDYVTFFKENPDAASELAIEWDLEKYEKYWIHWVRFMVMNLI